MKTLFQALVISICLVVFSCKKKKETPTSPTPSPSVPTACTPVIVEIIDNITTPTVWEDCHIYVINTTYINVSSTLTIKPGAIIKFKNQIFDNSITVSSTGKILAMGTAEKPIIFTSIKDDANGGDTNGDGTTTTPARRDWGGIVMNTEGCVYTYCRFLYGGKGPSAGAAQPSLEFQFFYGTVDYCTFAYCGGDTLFNGYGVVDANLCSDPRFSITNSVFYGCIKPIFMNAFLSIDNSNIFHNPANVNEINQLNGIFISNEGNSVPADIAWLENEVPFVLTGVLSLTKPGTKLSIANGVIIKVKNSIAPGNKISLKNSSTEIVGYNLPGVFFTSYLDDAHGGDTNGDGTATSPNPSDWYGILDVDASIQTNNFCYPWPNILYAQYP